MEEKENNLAEEELDTLEEMEQEQEQNTTELLDLVKSKKVDKLRDFVSEHSPIDIAYMLNELEDDIDIVFLFKAVQNDITAEIFSYLDHEQKEKIVKAFSSKEVRDLIDKMATDDLVDFVEELPGVCLQHQRDGDL